MTFQDKINIKASKNKMQFSYLHFKHPHVRDGVIDSRKKFDRESSSEVRKMLGCLKCKYENCIFYLLTPLKVKRNSLK